MKTFITFCAIASSSLLLSQQAGAQTLQDLTSLQWKHRIILVDETHQDQHAEQLFQQQNLGVDDRDVLWFVFKADKIETNYSGNLGKDLLSNARVQYGLGTSKVILIGKDGGVKTRLDRLGLDALFADIDRMPMRKREMLRE